MEGPFYTTAELCALIGISKNTILRWESSGIIPVAMRDGRGWRVWPKEAVEIVMEVKKGKEIKSKNEESVIHSINIIGYGNQARVWAKNLKDSKVNVNILIRENSASISSITRDGFEALNIKDGIKKEGIFCVLIPDEKHEEFFEKYKPFISEKSLFIFAHGYSVSYKNINVRKALLAPKAIAKIVRANYLDNKKTPAAFFCEKEDEKIIKVLAEKLGFSPLIESSFLEEVTSDLLSEQVLLCGAVPALIIKTFNKLKEKGISPKIAALECVYELEYILNVIKEKGIYNLYNLISPAALSGGAKVWEKVDESFNKLINETMEDISSKEFLKYFDNFEKSHKEEFINKISKESKSLDETLNALITK